MKFKTASGSEYEINDARAVLDDYDEPFGLLVRRLSGTGEPTARVGRDTVWRICTALIPAEPVVGLPVLIHWKMNEDGSMNCTLTSPVTEVST